MTTVTLNGNQYELKFTNRDLLQYQTETGKTLSTLIESIRSIDADAIFTLVWLGVRHAIPNIKRDEIPEAMPLITSGEVLAELIEGLAGALQLTAPQKKTETLTDS